MAVSLVAAANLLVEMLNESIKGDAFGNITATKERYKRTEVEYYCVVTDAAIARRLILDKDGRMKDFMTTSSVAHGADIPTHIGDVDSIYFTVTGGEYAGVQPADIVDFKRIQIDNLNPQALPLTPKAAVMGDRLFNNGSGQVAGGAASVVLTASYAVLVINLSACVSPDEMMRAVVLGGFAMAIQKDGHKSGAAAVAQNMYQAELKVQGVGQMQVPQAA